MEMHIWVSKVSNGFIVRWSDQDGVHDSKDIMVVEREGIYGLSNQIERNILAPFFAEKEAE